MIKHLAAAALLATICATSANAQRRDEDYARRVDRLTYEEVQVPSPRDRGFADPERRPFADAPEREVRESEYLNDASDYADEPHRVRLVDRSRFADAFVPTDVDNVMGLARGDVLIDTRARQLYVGIDGSTARRYGVAVGKAGATWRGTATVGRMARWPDWRPTASIRKENRKLKAVVDGGASNPLGARAIYLYQGGRDTLYRIHGTNAPYSIGKFASHGCIRMVNEDVIELYELVGVGATVTVR